MAAAPIADALIRGGDRFYAEHVQIWHCSWKCFSPAVRWIPSAVWEQWENTKWTSHPKAEVAHCVFSEGKGVHRPLCLHTCVLSCLALKPSGELIGSRLEPFACIRAAKSGCGSKTNKKTSSICRTTRVPTTNHSCSCIREKGRVVHNSNPFKTFTDCC